MSRGSPPAPRSWCLAALAFGIVVLAPGVAQEDPSGAAPQAPPEQQQPTQEPITKLVTLRVLADDLARKDEEIRAAREALSAATSDDARLRAARELEQLETARAELRRNFETLATGIDVEQFTAPGGEVDLLKELESLLRPLIEELKDATATPRQIEALRAEIELQEERSSRAVRAVEQLQLLIERAQQPELLRYLRQASTDWQDRAQVARSRAAVARSLLEQELEERRSLIESTGDAIQRFFRTRGLNLLIGVVTFLVVLFGLRLLYGPVQRELLRRHGGNRPFYLRLIGTLVWLGSGLAATLGLLLVFWVRSDWMLLGLGLIFLLGLAWTSRQMLPHLFEQIRMFLNIGSVREGERIVLDGIPWRVKSLNVYTRLENPALSGGNLRVPLRDLVGERSRPCVPHEIWFPCGEGDWVELADGVRGRVVHQGPEFVQVVLLGGARQTYPTAAFLGLNPRNLSTNFRIRVAFGVDYQHQAIVTTQIPERMRAAVERDLVAAFGADKLIHLAVEFAEAGASSLDVHVLADFDGAVAARHDNLMRAIQRSLVDACNAHGWVIPFMQVTVHQAAPPGYSGA